MSSTHRAVEPRTPGGRSDPRRGEDTRREGQPSRTREVVQDEPRRVTIPADRHE
jgi:hypothetical protein